MFRFERKNLSSLSTCCVPKLLRGTKRTFGNGERETPPATDFYAALHYFRWSKMDWIVQSRSQYVLFFPICPSPISRGAPDNTGKSGWTPAAKSQNQFYGFALGKGEGRNGPTPTEAGNCWGGSESNFRGVGVRRKRSALR